MAVWIRSHKNKPILIAPSSPVYRGSRKAIVSTVNAGTEGASFLSTIREGSGSLCFKDYKAQTFGHLAPGCKDALFGLDPTNTSRLQLYEGHTDEKCYQEEGGTLPTFRKTYDKTTFWKKYAPRTSTEKLCEGSKQNGQPCQRLAQPGGRYCATHSKGTA